jgi:hypothetical protein
MMLGNNGVDIQEFADAGFVKGCKISIDIINNNRFYYRGTCSFINGLGVGLLNSKNQLKFLPWNNIECMELEKDDE